MKKFLCIFISVSLCFMTCIFFYSCSPKTDSATVTVTFYKNDSICFEDYYTPKKRNTISTGQTVYVTKDVTKGSFISPPSDPTSLGVSALLGASYIFGGWYKEPSCENAFDFNNEPINTNINLYAKWLKL